MTVSLCAIRFVADVCQFEFHEGLKFNETHIVIMIHCTAVVAVSIGAVYFDDCD